MPKWCERQKQMKLALVQQLQHHKTLDLEVVCKDTTKEEVGISTPLSLERAIRKCARINSPNSLDFLCPPADYSWTGWMGLAIDDLKKEVTIKTEAKCDGQGLAADVHRRVLAHRLFRHRPDHWGIMIRDHSPLNQHKSCRDYLLRSEIMGITSIIYRQMNEVRWDPSKSKYTEPELIYSGGPLIMDATLTFFLATVVAFIPSKVRVVQATCDPSNASTSLTFALRALYNLSMSCYDKTTAQKVLKWIFCPPNPAQGPRRGKTA
ncbi:uncharacterized protein PADG_03761 [Paracoccidioides brasiliensis Pb18]|uniref:Uncharacterized protein n=2 Tax=Paracoccidioides brasiliensis TaxID=121759 RepID=C1G925_PARBD|nr:uncharacterized protein PADG_03761 [Paracoccidioides brasiliensis Pb18]EEH47677.1 hypothetical protein PADG_03761 [Paracoccidioides brasiliensis Pb18]ODH45109.1 hypothetical protein ACO22_00404 [Paracoccidioides brasiliensis]